MLSLAFTVTSFDRFVKYSNELYYEKSTLWVIHYVRNGSL